MSHNLNDPHTLVIIMQSGRVDVVITPRNYEEGGFSTLAVDSLKVEMAEILDKVIKKRRLQIHGECTSLGWAWCEGVCTYTCMCVWVVWDVHGVSTCSAYIVYKDDVRVCVWVGCNSV